MTPITKATAPKPRERCRQCRRVLKSPDESERCIACMSIARDRANDSGDKDLAPRSHYDPGARCRIRGCARPASCVSWWSGGHTPGLCGVCLSAACTNGGIDLGGDVGVIPPALDQGRNAQGDVVVAKCDAQIYWVALDTRRRRNRQEGAHGQ